MSDPHTNNLLIRLGRVYGEPKTGNAAGFMAEYARAMQGYSHEEREQAAAKILATHRFKTWPTIAECLQVLDDVRFANKVKSEAVGRAATANSWLERERKRKEDEATWSPEAFLEANQLIQSAMGRLAAEQGWILGLHDFCRRHRRLPDAVREAKVIAGMKESATYVDDCLAGKIDMGLCAAALRKMAQSMRAKRGDLRRAVMGEDGPC